MAADLKIKIEKFLGIDNINRSQKVPEGTLKTATNVDVNNDLTLSRRKGYAELDTGNYRSLWSNNRLAFAIKDDQLVRVFPDGGTSSIGDNLNVDSGVVYVDGKDGYVYCANYTFMIRTDGVNVYTPEQLDKTEKSSYSSPAITNYEIIDAGLVSGDVDTKRNKTIISGATVLEVYRGKMYAAKDNVLWLSDAYDFMRILKLEKNYLYFPTNITAIKAVDNGVYVSEEDKIWFLRGTSPKDFDFSVVYDAGIERGTDIRIDNIALGEQVISPAIMWTTKKGICIGTGDGQVFNLTERKYDMPSFITGAATFQREEGLDRYLVVTNS